jgi:hypothetical protein
MARGWESKDVENQQDLLEQRKAQREKPEKSASEQLLEDLHLQRTRVLSDLQTACNPRYRSILEESLRFLEQKINALADSAKQPPAE